MAIDETENNMEREGDNIQKEQQLEGLGGWLVLVGIGVIIGPFLLFYEAISVYQYLDISILKEHISLFILVFSEVIVNLLLFITQLYLIYLFFNKKKEFSKWYFGVLVFAPLFIFFDSLAVTIIFPEENIFDQETTKTLVQGILQLMVWGTYIKVSKRVKNTFVK